MNEPAPNSGTPEEPEASASKEKSPTRKQRAFVLFGRIALALMVFGIFWRSSADFRAFFTPIALPFASSHYLSLNNQAFQITTRERLKIAVTSDSASKYVFKVFKRTPQMVTLKIKDMARFESCMVPSVHKHCFDRTKFGDPVASISGEFQFFDFLQGNALIALPKLPPGDYIYTVEGLVGDKVVTANHLGAFRVSDLGLLVRECPGNTVVIKAFNLLTLEPVAGAKIDLFKPPNTNSELSGGTYVERPPYKLLKSLVSGADGCVTVSVEHRNHHPSLEYAAYHAEGRATALSHDNIVYANSWGNFTAPYLTGGEQNADYIFDLITDRTVYRLGQEVHFKGLLRLVGPKGLVNPGANMPVEVKISDPEGRDLAIKSLRTGAFGDYEGYFSIAGDGKTGTYTVTTTASDDVSMTSTASVEVMQYRKPEYEVTVEPVSAITTSGDQVQMKVKATYFFGGPVKNAKISFNADAYPDEQIRSELKEAPPYYKFFGALPGLNIVPSYTDPFSKVGEAVTDENGEAIITFDTNKIANEASYPYDGRYLERDLNLRVTVTDVSRKTEEGAGTALLTAGNFALLLRTDSTIIKSGEEMVAKVTAIDYDKRPVKQKPVTVSLEYWESPNSESPKKKTISQQTVTTDEHGNSNITVKVPDKLSSGQYQLVVSATDDKNRTVKDFAYYWIAGSGESSWYSEDNNIKIELDKPVYKAGEKARAVITTPGKDFGESAALVTVSGSALYHHKGVKLKPGINMLEFVVSKDAIPECQLEVVSANQSRKTLLGSVPLLIYPEPYLLKVDVTPEKKLYGPADIATVSFNVRKPDGTPAPNTELVVSAVDESIYAVRPDTHAIEKSFYSPRVFSSSVVTGFMEYVEPVLEKRANSFDIAWLLQPYPRGAQCELAKCCADNQLRSAAPLALSEGAPAPSLAGATNGTIGPQGADASVMDAIGAGSFASVKSTRSNFLDSAFWSANIITDSKGLAKAKFKLPDNLTTWRVTASAASKQSDFGSGKSNLRVSKELLARLALPRFFTRDDKGIITGIVHNYTTKEQIVQVTLKPSPQFVFDKPLVQKVKIAPNGVSRLTWPVNVKGEGKGTVELIAQGQTDSDALKQTIPLRDFSFPVFATKNGILKEDALVTSLPMKLTPDAIAGTGKFEVNVAASAIGPVLGNFDELIDYPYGCTEQTMSRMMPSVVAMELHTKLGLPLDPETQKLFRDVQRRSFIKLAEHQNDNGGWGWWRGDKTNPYLTAYVMEGLFLLQQAGYTVDKSMIDSGTTVLQELCQNKTAKTREEITDLAYAAYVSSLWGNEMRSNKVQNLANSVMMGPEGLAYLTLALHKQGDEKAARAVYDQLLELANKTWEFTNWEHTAELTKKLGERGTDYTYRFTGVESTALAMQAVLAMEPENEKLLTSIRRWIVLQHDQHGWSNTKTTARVFIAMLADELHAGKGKPTNFTATAFADGKSLASFVFNKDNQYGAEQTFTTALTGKEQQLQIKKFGTGRLYYTSLLSYKRPIPPGKTVVARSSPPDLSVKRNFYKLVPFVDPKTKVKGVRAEELGTGAVKAGDLILMKLSINSPVSVPYVMVDAALPSGAEIVSKDEPSITPSIEDGSFTGGTYPISYWWSHQDVLDDRIVFFADMLPAGNSEFQSLMRMEMPGKFNVNPVTFEGMYTKAVRGYSSADQVSVEE